MKIYGSIDSLAVRFLYPQEDDPGLRARLAGLLDRGSTWHICGCSNDLCHRAYILGGHELSSRDPDRRDEVSAQIRDTCLRKVLKRLSLPLVWIAYSTTPLPSEISCLELSLVVWRSSGIIVGRAPRRMAWLSSHWSKLPSAILWCWFLCFPQARLDSPLCLESINVKWEEEQQQHTYIHIHLYIRDCDSLFPRMLHK